MKFLILAFAVACVQAQPGDQDAPIIRSASDVGIDSYHYEYETGNGISAQEDGALSRAEYPSIAAKGSYKYTSPEGQVIETSYVADENGFQPQGSHIPAVPEYIAKAVEYIQAHPPPPPRS